MLASAHSFTLDGIDVHRVDVEVDVRRGLPAFTIIGLPDAAIREARERVRTAILNSGFEFPPRRVTANLAPADVHKAGPGLDLALACALLAATGQLPAASLQRRALLGELALDGAVRGCRGALAIAHAALAAGLGALALARADAPQAALVPGLAVEPLADLRDAVRVLRGGTAEEVPPPSPPPAHAAGSAAADLADVRGQHRAVDAVVVAAAGGHNLLLCGAPGTGKTMLAHRLPSILPPLSPREAIEVARIGSLCGRPSRALATARPFRAPHHSITPAGLAGGAGNVGEVVLAHNGVLFLDELAEFARATLDALRQPVEEGRVTISRARRSATYPARFMLVAATNPCACGRGSEATACSCTAAQLARHRRRLSGPLVDRIDLAVPMDRATGEGLQAAPLTSSARARERVLEARERQTARRPAGGVLNAQLGAAELRLHSRLEERAGAMLERAATIGMLSARGQLRVLRVARTLADLDGCGRVRARHVGVALATRPEAALAAHHAAIRAG